MKVMQYFQCGFGRIDQRRTTYCALVRELRKKLNELGKSRVEETDDSVRRVINLISNSVWYSHKRLLNLILTNFRFKYVPCLFKALQQIKGV